MKTKKTITISSLIVISLLVSLFYFTYNYYYPPLNNDSVKLFILDKKIVPDEDNVEFSIIGLTAPKEIIDFHGFGIQQYKKAIEAYASEDRKYISTEASLPEVENSISIKINNDKILCWINTSSDITNDCYSHNEIIELINNNKLILDRYEILKNRKNQDSFLLLSGKKQILINLQKLFLSKVKLLLLTGKEEIAIPILLKDLEFHRAMITQDATWIGKAISLVLYGLNLNLIEYAITNHSNIINSHYDELIHALREPAIDDFNLEGIFRKEFEMINFLFCMDEKLCLSTSDFCQSDTRIDSVPVNFIMNDYHDMYLNYKNMINLDIDNMMQTCKRESDNEINIYYEMLIHMPISPALPTYSLIKGGMLKGCEMMVNYKVKIAKHRFYKVYIDLKKLNLTGENINNHLQMQADSDYLTGQKFIYESNNNILRFPDTAPSIVSGIKLSL